MPPIKFGGLFIQKDYIEKTKRVTPENFEVPELYIGGKNIPNRNTPLAWSVSMSYLFFSKIENIRSESVR